MERAYDPVGQTIDVDSYITINLGTPGRQSSPLLVESVNRLLAHVPNDVHRRLEVYTVLMHDNGDHVMRIAF